MAKIEAPSTLYFYHTDPAGTALAMTNTSGTVVWKTDYKPFGEEQSITSTIENNEKFAGKEKDKETGLYYFGARYLGPKTGRFVTVDPVGAVNPSASKTNETLLLNPQKLNLYSYSLNNPYRYIDHDGREVTIIIQRDKYTKTSVTGTITATSDVTNSTFKGYTLENTHAGDNQDKSPIPPGTYDAFMRTDHTPNRVELQDVDGYENIQIHNGNTARQVKGCFAVGTTRSKNHVNNSLDAMGQINNIIQKDGTDNIRVTVTGPSTQQKKELGD